MIVAGMRSLCAAAKMPGMLTAEESDPTRLRAFRCLTGRECHCTRANAVVTQGPNGGKDDEHEV
jgi:hypothetical protein